MLEFPTIYANCGVIVPVFFGEMNNIGHWNALKEVLSQRLCVTVEPKTLSNEGCVSRPTRTTPDGGIISCWLVIGWPGSTWLNLMPISGCGTARDAMELSRWSSFSSELPDYCRDTCNVPTVVMSRKKHRFKWHVKFNDEHKNVIWTRK